MNFLIIMYVHMTKKIKGTLLSMSMCDVNNEIILRTT